MQPVTRIEFISDAVEMHKILDSLDRVGVSNYTVLPNVLGKSRQGEVFDDMSVTGLGGQVYIISYCLPDQVKTVVEEIRPILNKFGGSCYICDAMEVRSVKCISSL
jgi:nitrogen regulatory protein PII